MDKVWFITGAARGMGKAIADAALQAGDCVVATTRKPDDFQIPEGCADRVLSLQLDVSNTDQSLFDAAVQRAVEKFGRVDVLVNNAGYGSVTFFEETEEEAIKKQFEVNLFGLMRVTRAVLPVMRNQRSGHIINIASGSGYSAGPTSYHTSKFAVTGFSVSLAFEVAPFGIKVTNAGPGMFRTSFYDKGTWRITPDKHIEDYDACRWQDGFIANLNPQGDPQKLAQVILEVANADKPPLHLPIGEDAPTVLEAYAEQLKADTDAWREKVIYTSY